MMMGNALVKFDDGTLDNYFHIFSHCPLSAVTIRSRLGVRDPSLLLGCSARYATLMG